MPYPWWSSQMYSWRSACRSSSCVTQVGRRCTLQSSSCSPSHGPCRVADRSCRTGAERAPERPIGRQTWEECLADRLSAPRMSGSSPPAAAGVAAASPDAMEKGGE
jgi:hypothetical protein